MSGFPFVRGGNDRRLDRFSPTKARNPKVGRRHMDEIGKGETSPWLSETAISELLLHLQDTFGWSPRASGFRTVHTRPIRSGLLYRCHPVGSAGGDLVMKIRPKWDGTTVESLYRGSRRVAGSWRPSGGFRVVCAIGFSVVPPCLCMPYVDGQDLPRVLAQSSREDLEHWLTKCGQAIGAFHSHFAPRQVDLSPARKQALQDLRRVAKRLRLPTLPLSGVARREVISVAYGDFSPQNIRIEPGGNLCLLDPPPERLFRLVHCDLAAFMVALERLSALGGVPARRAGRGESVALLDTLLEGYARTGPGDFRTPEDRGLVRLYCADRWLRAARAAWRRRRPRSALLWALRFAGDYLSTVAKGASRRMA